METTKTIDGILFSEMLRAGAAELRANADTINELNVFPIPDGDTGSNMLLTIMGGVNADKNSSADISVASRSAADGMLLAARGNSGVILSQLFDGIAKGLKGSCAVDTEILAEAFKSGVKSAYEAVLKPTEGTILTVARCALENTKAVGTPSAYMAAYIYEAKKTLEKTPEMLPILKKAGVIDSGGAGLVCILEGMHKALRGEAYGGDEISVPEKRDTLDFDKFTENSELTYGYCTEVLLRLQNIKTDVEAFDVTTVTDYLQGIGDSVVAFKTGSIVKIHVHTMTPHKVLEFAQKYGEFLSVKIENMSLQHNNTTVPEETVGDTKSECKKYGVVAVCAGEGIKEMFCDIGVDIIVDGGQSMNPSAEDFINAFSKTYAEHIFVLPNNGNVILAAEQAAKMYSDAEIIVLPSKTVGEGYAALSMMNPVEESVDKLAEEMREAMAGVATAEVSHCIREAEMDGIKLHIGDYVGVCGKKLLTASSDRLEAASRTIDSLNMSDYDICLIIRGVDAGAGESELLAEYVRKTYRGKEIYVVDGKQKIYDYIFILQ